MRVLMIGLPAFLGLWALLWSVGCWLTGHDAVAAELAGVSVALWAVTVGVAYLLPERKQSS